MNVKMILSDLDGTLIRSDGSISERTKEILKSCQSRGIYVVISTARYWIGAERYIEEIQPDYEITTDGTPIHRQGKQIYSCNLEIEDTNRIIQDILARDSKTEITVAAGRQVFWNSEHISEAEKLHKAVYCDYQKPLFCQANKIVAELPDYKTAGKVQAIQELAKLLNISLSDIAAFGDDKNDMEMLQICGMGVAVSNAVSDVKNVADSITRSNDEDGVAEWLAKNVL